MNGAIRAELSPRLLPRLPRDCVERRKASALTEPAYLQPFGKPVLAFRIMLAWDHAADETASVGDHSV